MSHGTIPCLRGDQPKVGKTRFDDNKRALKAQAECFLAGLLDSGAAPTGSWDFADINELDFNALATWAETREARRARPYVMGLCTLYAGARGPAA